MNIYINDSSCDFYVTDLPYDENGYEVLIYYDNELVFYEEAYTKETHSKFEIDDDNIHKVEISRDYYKGRGNSEILNGEVFNDFDEAINYGRSGNKWYRIDSIHPTDEEIKTLNCGGDFQLGDEAPLYKYRVVTFNEMSFGY